MQAIRNRGFGNTASGRFIATALAGFLALWALAPVPAVAQGAQGINVPGFWDPNRRFSKPDRTKVLAIRFVTELESPPFSFTGPDGLPAGFNVDLARAVCEELDIPCTIQELKWDFLIDAISEGKGDAIIAPIPITAENRKRFSFSNPFLGLPGRFVATSSTRLVDITDEAAEGLRVGVVSNTPHAAFLAAYFPAFEQVEYDSPAAMREGLTGGAVELIFTDALSSAVWLNSQAGRQCCVFVGGAYTDPNFFGEGIAVAVDPARRSLREAIDFALSRIYMSGRYFEIFLRYFPRGYY